jgi:hypothetical protein
MSREARIKTRAFCPLVPDLSIVATHCAPIAAPINANTRSFDGGVGGKIESETPPSTVHLSDGEIRRAVQTLTDGEKTAVMKIARVYAIKTPYDHEDLFQEAICRLFEGTRVWPRDVSAILVLAGVMRSIAWGWRRRTLDTDRDLLQSSPNQEWVVLVHDVIMAFDGKPLRQQILIEMLKGTKGQELREWIARLLQKKGMAAGTDVPKLDSILKEIRRDIEKFRR